MLRVGSSGVGSDQEIFTCHGSGRVGSGRVGSGRVGSGRVGSGRVGLGRSGGFGSGRVASPWPDPNRKKWTPCMKKTLSRVLS